MLTVRERSDESLDSRTTPDQEQTHSSRMNRPGALRFALVASALVLGILAQALVSNGSFQWAITPYVVAVLAMALAVAKAPLSSQEPGARGWGLGTRVNPPPPAPSTQPLVRWGLAVMALGAALLASSLYLFTKEPPNTLAWYFYGLSVVLVVLALPAFENRWTPLVNAWKSRARLSFGIRDVLSWIGLAAVIIFALMVRLYNLSELPAGLWYDESDNISHARAIQSDPGSTPVFVRSTNLPSLFLLPIAAVVELTGVSITTGRLVSVAFGIIGIVAVFLLVRLMLGPLMGLVAAFLVAVMRWDINWSRIGMHGITAPLFAALTAYLTFRALRSGRFSDFGLAGAALGLGMWFYASFRLFPLVLAFILLHALVFRQEGRWRLVANTVVMVVAALVVAAPVVQSAIVDSDAFFARTSTTSVFFMMPLDDALREVKTSLGKHLMMFHYEGDPNARHNLPGAPMLDFLSGVLMVLGAGVALARWRNVALAVLPFWVLFMLLPGVITLPWEAPQSLRAIAVTPAVIALITLSIGAIWRVGRSAPWPRARKATPFFVAALLGAIAFMNINTYFGAQARHPEVFAAFTTDETLMAPHMLEQQRKGYSLLVSRQLLYSLTASLLANNPRLETIAAPTTIPLDPSRVWQGASIYFEPREAGFYQVMRAYYPDGEFREVRPPAGGDALFYSAVLSREQLERNQGLIEKRLLANGMAHEAIKTSTESIWFLESQPQDMPFDFTWEGTLHVVIPGEYMLMLEGMEEAEVFLDGRPILSGEERAARIEPAVGLHALEVRGRVTDHNSFLRLLWQIPGSENLEPIPVNNLYHGPIRPIGLAGRFFASGEESEAVDARRVTPTLDTFWYDPVISEPYLAVCDGTLQVNSGGQYRFRLDAFGGLKLLLDGELVAETPGGAEGQITLSPGSHRIRVEYITQNPPSEFDIQWSPPGEPMVPVPVELLTPDPQHMFRIVGDS